MQRGFIQIPILIAIILTAVLGGGAYVAYEVAKPSQSDSPKEITVETETQATTTTDTSTTVQVDKKTDAADEKDSVIDSLKKQVADLTQKVSAPKTEAQNTAITPKTTTITLPNGAIVEMDANGNIIRTIKEAPATNSAPTQVAPTTNPNISTSPTAISVSLDGIATTLDSAHVEWRTNLPTDSKIFLTLAGNTVQLVPSKSGNSTQHFADLNNLKAGTQYSYTIEAISGSQVQKKDGTFTTEQQTLSVAQTTSSNPNDTVPFIKFSSNGGLTIKKLVFLNDESYCTNNGYGAAQLTPQNTGAPGLDAVKDSSYRFVAEYPGGGFAWNGGTLRLSHGVNQPSTTCTNVGIRLTLLGGESIVYGKDGQQLSLGDLVITGQ